MKVQRLLLIPIVASLMLCLTQVGQAQLVPFRSVGANNQYSPATGQFSGFGNTTHMGKSFGMGLAIPGFTPNPLILTWTGSGKFVAANGAEMNFSGGGLVFLVPLGNNCFTANWVGKFTINGGTGRFTNAKTAPNKPLDVIAINKPFKMTDPIWYYDYEIRGQVDLGKRK